MDQNKIVTINRSKDQRVRVEHRMIEKTAIQMGFHDIQS